VAEVGRDGKAFLSTSLSSPVDVTIVTDDGAVTSVETVVGVQSADLDRTDPRVPTPGYSNPQGRVTGKVNGWTGSTDDLSLAAYGDGLVGPANCCTIQLDATGAYAMDVMGPSPGKVDVVAVGLTRGSDDVVAMGMAKDVSVSDGVVATQDVTLDHAAD